MGNPLKKVKENVRSKFLYLINLKLFIYLIADSEFLLPLQRVQCRTPQNLVIMKEKKIYLNEQVVKQISVALTLYVSTFEKCGIGLDSMPTVASLIEQFNKL